MKLILKAGPNQMETLRRLRTEAAAIDKDVTVHSDRIRQTRDFRIRFWFREKTMQQEFAASQHSDLSYSGASGDKRTECTLQRLKYAPEEDRRSTPLVHFRGIYITASWFSAFVNRRSRRSWRSSTVMVHLQRLERRHLREPLPFPQGLQHFHIA